mgnify:CR=1 FL=1
MKKTIFYASALCISLFSANTVAAGDPDTNFDKPTHRSWNVNKPWRVPQDSTTAMNKPDLYAWQLFVSLNWPVDENKCKPDRDADLGEPGKVVWETWQSREETFLPGAQQPATWRQGCKQGGFATLPSGDYTVFADEDIRISKSAYNYIRDNKLYSLDEQERLARAGVRDLSFPLGAKTAKAHWVRITEEDKPRYHWAEVERDGETHIYGVSGFHIVSKDMPTWFWATFEHVDNELRWPQTYPDAFLGWLTPSRDAAACPPGFLSCNEIPAGLGLEGTKWENYRLRGTQIDWVDNRGTPTSLANSQLESFMDLETSSCLTCHALAVKGETGDPKPIGFLKDERNAHGLKLGFTGPPSPAMFRDENGVEVPYIGLDYVWVLRKAQREE